MVFFTENDLTNPKGSHNIAFEISCTIVTAVFGQFSIRNMALSYQRKIALFSLLFYWPALFVFAHIPMPLLVRNAGVSDKGLHFLAYLILFFLLWFAFSGDTKVNWRRGTVWWVLLIVVMYAIFDEWLQIYVAGRSCDVKDFLADMAGALAGLIFISMLNSFQKAS